MDSEKNRKAKARRGDAYPHPAHGWAATAGEGTGFCMGLHKAHGWGSAGPPNPPVHFCSHLLNSHVFVQKLFYLFFNLVDFQSSRTARAAHFACRCSALAASKPL